jgi:hypothetical protein
VLQKPVLISGHMNGVIERMMTQIMFADAMELMKREAAVQEGSSSADIGGTFIEGKQYGKW